MWIKHYSNARQSEYMSKLFAKYGWDGYGKYWGLLEYLATNYTGGEPLFHVPRETIRGLFGVRSWSDLQSFVDHLTNERVLKFALCDNVYRIEAPILLDLLNRDFKRARTERVASAPREDKKREEKKIEERNAKNIFSGNKFFKRISLDTQALILSTYPEEFVKQVIVNASAYLDKHHHRYVNNEDSFLTNQLKIQWEYREARKPGEEKRASDIDAWIRGDGSGKPGGVA